MTATRRQLGTLVEHIVAGRLSRAGWEIVARNERSRYGEIDIIALDRGALVFVEVKAARPGAHAGPERPSLAVGHQKQRRIRRLAAVWLADRPPLRHFDRIRFDVIGVVLAPGDQVADYEHIEDAF